MKTTDKNLKSFHVLCLVVLPVHAMGWEISPHLSSSGSDHLLISESFTERRVHAAYHHTVENFKF